MASKKQKGIVQKTSAKNKTFSYSLDDVQLNFTLRVDTKQQLETFKTIILVALGEIDKELEAFAAPKPKANK